MKKLMVNCNRNASAIKKYLLLLITTVLLHSFLYAQNQNIDTAKIKVTLNNEIAPMKPIWAWFGYDEPNYTYMKDGKILLTEIAALSPVPVYVRVHNLLTSGDGTPELKWGSTNIYTEDVNGNPVYNFHIVDSIFDTYIKRGIKPLAQIGFMPEALSIHPDHINIIGNLAFLTGKLRLDGLIRQEIIKSGMN